MNFREFGILILASFLGVEAVVANSATIRLANNSVIMSPGKCSCGAGFDFYLYFSSTPTEDPMQANGEIFPQAPGGGYTHYARMILQDVSMFGFATDCQLNIPAGPDADGDGIPDFQDPGRAFAASSSGIYYSDFGIGAISAGWTRTAGSRMGTCVIYLEDPMLGRQGPFNHTFEIVDGNGTMNYTATADGITGTVAVSMRGFPVPSLSGPVQMSRSTSDPYDSLTLLAGGWSDGTTYLYAYADTPIQRSASKASTYEANLGGWGGGFQSWKLFIIDNNDRDGDGIPDLSDDTIITPPRQPTLQLASAGTELRLSIRGDVGQTCVLQESLALSGSAWSNVRTNTLTAELLELSLAKQGNGAKFYRIKLQ